MFATRSIILGVLAGVLFFGFRFVRDTQAMDVRDVIFEEPLPATVRENFPIRPKQNLLLLRPRTVERDLLKRYSELEDVSVSRTLRGAVKVSARYRRPIAFVAIAGNQQGIDRDGVVFPLSEAHSSVGALPTIKSANTSDRILLLKLLDHWKSDAPNFYSLVKNLETDRMHRLSVEMSDNVFIDWDEMDLQRAVIRAERVIKLRTLFAPKKVPARLKFVTDDRIVMDANWTKSATH